MDGRRNAELARCRDCAGPIAGATVLGDQRSRVRQLARRAASAQQAAADGSLTRWRTEYDRAGTPAGPSSSSSSRAARRACDSPDGETTNCELDGSDGKTRRTVVHSRFDSANPPCPGGITVHPTICVIHSGRKQHMARLVLKMSVSLDGYVASSDGSSDWLAAGGSDDALSWTVETVSNASAHLMGATTYAAMAAHWPSDSGPFAKPMNEIPKVVFSNSLTSADWDQTTIAAGDLAEAITRLKQEHSTGYLLAHGGARFVRSLVATGLIDEYRLLIHPAVLGAGERIFHAPLTIEAVSTTVFSGGAVAHVFTAHP
jgi:dihydrofolate reductase